MDKKKRMLTGILRLFYMFFRSRDFTQMDGMRAIGGRDHYRETRTHSAELSPNSV